MLYDGRGTARPPNVDPLPPIPEEGENDCKNDDQEDEKCDFLFAVRGNAHEYLLKIRSDAPKNFEEAIRHDHYADAIEVELSALEANKTWKIVKKGPGMQILNSLWIFNAKRRKDGSIERYKARLVGDGRRRYGVNFSDRYAPTVRASTIRMLLAIAVRLGMTLRQCDVNNAYLHGSLTNPVYMRIPKGRQHLYDPHRYCCQVLKGIYGLPESGKVWNDEFDRTMLRLGYKRSVSDPCLYYKGSIADRTLELVTVYVDDVIIATFDGNTKLIDTLREKYGVKNDGPLDYVLGVAMDQSPNKITLNQEKYIDDVLRRFDMQDCKGVSTPLNSSLKITKTGDGVPADKSLYQSIIGSIAYAMTWTRPDLAYSVSKLSRYLNEPTRQHMNQAKHVLRYLKKTKKYKLTYRRGTQGLEGYTDADFAGCLDTRKSTSGCVITIDGNAVIWKARRQSVPVKSSAAAEYIALAEATDEVLWARGLLRELGFNLGTTTMHEDNQATIKIGENQILSERTKSLDITYHRVRHYVQNKIIKLQYVSTEEQMADILTKAAPKAKYDDFAAQHYSV